MTATLLSLAEAAERLGCNPKWLAEQCRRDLVPCRKIGRYWKFTQADLDEFLERSKRGHDPWQRSQQAEAARRRRSA